MRIPQARLQERIESSELGRIAISAFLVLTLVVIFALNLPWQHQFELKRQLYKVALPYSKATGIQQAWSVFAPDSRYQSIEVRGRITYADGSVAIWRLPSSDRYVGDVRNTRWKKWMEIIYADEQGAVVSSSTALWLARRYARGGRRPVEVAFVRRWKDVSPLGANFEYGWASKVYYRLKITPELMKEKA